MLFMNVGCDMDASIVERRDWGLCAYVGQGYGRSKWECSGSQEGQFEALLEGEKEGG